MHAGQRGQVRGEAGCLISHHRVMREAVAANDALLGRMAVLAERLVDRRDHVFEPRRGKQGILLDIGDAHGRPCGERMLGCYDHARRDRADAHRVGIGCGVFAQHAGHPHRSGAQGVEGLGSRCQHDIDGDAQALAQKRREAVEDAPVLLDYLYLFHNYLLYYKLEQLVFWIFVK